ncbi:membrane-bound metal-dependent hydrolase [Halosimplex carlsbadense 2-9-1]|uniref:Membrane-bound metal-dependent hydrolase n=1 Tax=Halosimplex carlsbadense 2-9-1 TaxID=797114 RepID=M0CM63_9EURY|nr:metal-dependent hydrolase [Halosimplex carlsbadense]ELZ23462.1 membrane-bound metal-dependent hydrolase [Halosimplex carlsbadense 2-9-1]
MWPWEHLSVGYLLHSAVMRTLYRRPPGDLGTAAVAIGTQFPDLIDKPGGWVFGVLPSGTSVAHSAFVAVPVSLVAVAVARRRGVPEIGVAFAIGYLSHLVGDVFFSVLIGGGPAFGAVLWPLGEDPAGGTVSVLALVSRLFARWVEYLASPVGIGYVLFEVGLLAAAVAVWVRDGTPGPGALGRARRLWERRTEQG